MEAILPAVFGDFIYNIVELKGGTCTSGFGMEFCISYHVTEICHSNNTFEHQAKHRENPVRTPDK